MATRTGYVLGIANSVLPSHHNSIDMIEICEVSGLLIAGRDNNYYDYATAATSKRSMRRNDCSVSTI